MVGKRRNIPAATEAALWALSNGRCYAPRRPFPVIFEVRPGVYRKNAQIAHIYGISSPRYKEGLSVEERDSFSNLLLLCLAHHSEVDDKKTGEKRYPPEKLRKWKVDHEGSNGPALAALGSISEEQLIELLENLFTDPVERLQAIAEQLEKTGTLSAATVAELRQIVNVLTDTPASADARTAAALSFAAEVFGSNDFSTVAESLVATADNFPTNHEITQLREASIRLGDALELFPGDQDIAKLVWAAEVISAAAAEISRYGGES